MLQLVSVFGLVFGLFRFAFWGFRVDCVDFSTAVVVVVVQLEGSPLVAWSCCFMRVKRNKRSKRWLAPFPLPGAANDTEIVCVRNQFDACCLLQLTLMVTHQCSAADLPALANSFCHTPFIRSWIILKYSVPQKAAPKNCHKSAELPHANWFVALLESNEMQMCCCCGKEGETAAKWGLGKHWPCKYQERSEGNKTTVGSLRTNMCSYREVATLWIF